MATVTNKLIICIDTERIEPQQTNQSPKVLARRVRILGSDNCAVLGDSDWMTDGSKEKDCIRYAFEDFYAKGGFRNGVRRCYTHE